MIQLIQGKIPIQIHPLFAILIFLIGFLQGNSPIEIFSIAMIVFFSIVIHEYGHALTALFFEQKVKITLSGFGGLTERSGPKLPLWKDFIIVLNGPLAGISLFILTSLLLPHFPKESMTAFILVNTALLNLFWTIINLLPVQPLDGGHLLRIILEAVFGFRGIKMAFFLSMILGSIFASLFLLQGILLVGALFLLFTFDNFRSWQSLRGLTLSDRDSSMQALFQDAKKEYRIGDLDVAKSKLERVRQLTGGGIIFIASSELLSELFMQEENLSEAERILAPLEDQLDFSGLKLLHQILYKRGEYQKAITLGNRLFKNISDPDTAKFNSLSHASLHEVEPAIGWLKTAINEGLNKPNEVIQMKAYDAIREDALFQKFKEGISS